MKFHTEIKLLRLSLVKPFPGNPQVVSEEKMSMMRDYMQKHGWVGQMPVVWYNINEGCFYWISGHHRAEAAMASGIDSRKCEVIVDERYTWAQAHKDLLMYNNVHGSPNKDLEKEFITDMFNEFDGEFNDFKPEEIGFNEKELNSLLDEVDKSDIDKALSNVYEVVVECNDLEEQEEVYEKIIELGYKCKILTV